jgi:hypothetical protein
MKTIDKSGPEGNVFCILGYAKSFQRQLVKATGAENEVLADVLKNFTSMDYNGICDKLESTGLFEFTDGASEWDDEDEDGDDYED